MRPLDTVPAVRRLETDRSDVLAIEIGRASCRERV